MATIAISDLYAVGADLFKDPESFMTELDDEISGSKLTDVHGGSTIGCIAISISASVVSATGSAALSYYIGRRVNR